MPSIDAVHGLLHDGPEIEATVADLRRRGLYPDEVEVLHPRPGTYRLADESLHDDAVGARSGALWGAAAGLILGVAVTAAVAAVSDAGAVAGAFSTAAFAGFGALVGGLVGLVRWDTGDDDPERVVELGNGDAVVAVHCRHWRNRAHRILERHGARIIDDPSIET